MELSLSVIVAIVAVFLILKYVRKFASSIFSVLAIAALVVGFMYYKGLGPFEKNVADLAYLEDKYCGSDGDADICDCIIAPAKSDIAIRFSREERDSLTHQKLRAAYVLQKSLRATKESALACLTLKGEGGKYKEFLQDFVPIENKYLNMAGDKIKDLGNKLRDEVTSLKENKDKIDDKY